MMADKCWSSRATYLAPNQHPRVACLVEAAIAPSPRKRQARIKEQEMIVIGLNSETGKCPCH